MLLIIVFGQKKKAQQHGDQSSKIEKRLSFIDNAVGFEY